PERRGFAQGITHAFSRVGNSITPPLVAYLIAFISWRGSFVALGIGSLAWVFTWFWYFRDVPAEHRAATPADLARLPNQGQGISRKKIPTPWGPLVRRMAPITLVYFCYGWTLWLYLNWLPSYFVHEYKLDLKGSAIFSMLVFLAGGGRGRHLPHHLRLHRRLDRQLAAAVHRIARAAARRRGDGVYDASRAGIRTRICCHAGIALTKKPRSHEGSRRARTSL